MTAQSLQEQLIACIRAFGLHRPEQTPDGEPVSVAEAHALIELSRGESLIQNVLVQRLKLEKSTVSRLISIMERKGWITRTPRASDRRALELVLTDTGQRVAACLAEAREAKFAQLLAALPQTQHPMIYESLRLLVEALDTSD